MAAQREQRKVVTVLFCDLAGSTALGESVDPERLRALLAAYFERMKSIVERHGGEVVVCSAGPPRVQQVIREALARGADRAVHVEDDGLGAADAMLTAEALAVCSAAGLDPGVFVDVVSDSGAASVSPMFRDIGPKIVAGDFGRRRTNSLKNGCANRRETPGIRVSCSAA